MISFSVPLKPVPKGRPRLTRTGVFTPPETKRFEEDFQWLAKKHRPMTPLTGPLSLTVVFCFRRPKTSKRGYPMGDTDNLIKAVTDAMNEVFYVDDSQLVEIRARKTFATEDGIHLFLKEFSE